MKNILRRFTFSTLAFILILAQSASATDIQTWQGKFLSGSPNTQYQFKFTVYDDPVIGNSCWTNTVNLKTDSDKWWDTNQLGVADACNNANENYYLDININGVYQSPRRFLKALKYADLTLDNTFSQSLNVIGNLDAPNLVNKRNDLNYLYIEGDSLTDGSRRLSINEMNETELERLDEGAWQPSTLALGPGTLYLGQSLGLSAAGYHFMTEGADLHTHLYAHTEIHSINGTETLKVLNLDRMQSRVIVQPDSSGEFIGTNFTRPVYTQFDALLSRVYVKIGSVAATSPVHVEVRTGANGTGNLIWDWNYPASTFSPANTEINIDLPGFIEFEEGDVVSVTYKSDNIFSLKTNANITEEWLAFNIFTTYHNEALVTREWTPGMNHTEGEWYIDYATRKIYVSTGDGVQTGTFESNYDKWKELGPTNNNAQGSGWFSGGGLAYNPGTNTFNISSDIHYVIVNQTDGNNLQIKEYTFPATNDVSIGSVINEERWVALSAYANGTPKMDFLTLDLTADQRRDYAIVGRFWTDTSGYILGTGPYVEPAYGYGKTLEDLIVTFGSSFNIEGNIFSANGANMLLNKNAGKAFRYGAWSIDHPASPNIGDDPQVLGIDVYYYFTSNATAHNVTSTIQTQWENNGVLEDMPAQKFQCQQLWHWSYSQVVAVQYGQKLYGKIEDARMNCPTDAFKINAELTSGAKLRGWLIFKTGTTDLSDSATVDFLTAPNIWFGSGAAGGEGAGIYQAGVGINISESSFISLDTDYTDDRYFNTPYEIGDVALKGSFSVLNNSLNTYDFMSNPSSTNTQILVHNAQNYTNSYGEFRLYRTRGDINASVETVKLTSWGKSYIMETNFGIKTNDPIASLHVNGNIIGNRLNIGGTGFSPYVSFRLDSTQNAMILNRLTTAKRDAIGTANATEDGMLIFNTDTNTTEYFDGTSWVHSAGGDVFGPASSLDNEVTRFDGTSGKYIQSGSNIFINDNGDMGIGTNNPLAPFHIKHSQANQTLAIMEDSSGYGISVAGFLGSASIDPLFSGDDLYFGRTVSLGNFIVETEKFGIGTATPSAKLHVFSDTSASLEVESVNGTLGSVVYVTSSGNGSTWGEAQLVLSTNQSQNQWYIYMDDSSLGDLGDANKLGFWSSGATVMTLDGDNGSVGIGTTNPVSPLHVSANPTNGQIVKFSRISNEGAWIELNNSEGEFGIGTDENELYIYDRTDGEYRFTIDTLGKVGIGTIIPTNQLHVYSQSNAGGITIDGDSNPALTMKHDGITTGYLASVDGDGNYFTDAVINDTILRGEFGLKLGVYQEGGGHSSIAIDSLGRVGIGTSSPPNLFSIYTNSSSGNKQISFDDDGSGNLNIYMDDTFSNPLPVIQRPGGTTDLYIGDISGWGGDTYIMSDGEYVLSALSDGNVGIGTTTPYNTLNVIGDGNFTGNLYVGGNFTFNIAAYEELRFPANTFLLTGTFDPVFDGSSYGWGYRFDKWDQVIVIAEMPHSRKAGSNIKINFHWSPTTTNAGDVQWGLEYKWANIDGTFPVGTTVYVIDSAGLSPSKHQVTDDIVISGAGMTEGSILKARVFRSNNPTYDTYGDSAMLMSFDIEYEIDKIGSE
ncbi:MAG: hypothetical protein V3U92_19790 [Cellulophaga sp.]